MRARPGKPARVVHQVKRGTEVGAASFRGGTTTFATTTGKGRTALKTRSRKAKVERVANLFFHESQHNPDRTRAWVPAAPPTGSTPRTGDVETLVRRLLSPTGLAIADNGDMHVAELFRNRISRVAAGTTRARRWRGASLPGDVDIQNGRVWATRNVLTGLSGEEGERPRGQVVRYPR